MSRNATQSLVAGAYRNATMNATCPFGDEATVGECVPGTRKMVRNRARCCSRDGGRPSEAGLQEQASNSRKLRWSRAIVVNVTEKGVTNHVM